MAEKREEFIIKLKEYRGMYDNSFHSDDEAEVFFLIGEAGNVLWDWIEELLKEVEKRPQNIIS